MEPEAGSRLAAVATAIAAVLVARGAQAALTYDHLKCYKAKDAGAFSATVDLRPADDALFEVDAGCTLVVRSREVCFPVKQYLATTTATPLGIGGIDLANPFLCYRVKCPDAQFPDSVEMSDEFGTRTLGILKPSKVCAPALVGPAPSTTTTTTTMPTSPPRNCVDATPPNCDGTCNDYNFACIADAGACICKYVDVFGDCPMVGSTPPTCYGACSGSLSCLDLGGGACGCGLAY